MSQEVLAVFQKWHQNRLRDWRRSVEIQKCTVESIVEYISGERGIWYGCPLAGQIEEEFIHRLLLADVIQKEIKCDDLEMLTTTYSARDTYEAAQQPLPTWWVTLEAQNVLPENVPLNSEIEGKVRQRLVTYHQELLIKYREPFEENARKLATYETQ